MGRAVLYTRVSSRSQEDGYSLEEQERDERTYCDRQGHSVVALETDTFTGYDSLDERDGMQNAIKLIRHGQADTLVIWRVDRAGRFAVDNLLLHKEVSDAGGVLESVAEGKIPNTPEGVLMLSVFSYGGAKEREGADSRTQAGLDRENQHGPCSGVFCSRSTATAGRMVSARVGPGRTTTK